MGRRKDYPFNRREDKKMTNFLSGILAMLVVAPFAGCELKEPKLSPSTETIWVLVIAFITTFFICIPLIVECISTPELNGGEWIAGGLLILMWVCVCFQIRRYNRSVKKTEDKNKGVPK